MTGSPPRRRKKGQRKIVRTAKAINSESAGNVCAVCRVPYSTPATLRRHQRRSGHKNLGRKPQTYTISDGSPNAASQVWFQCQHCDWIGAKRDSLSQHMMTHQKPLPCPVCQQPRMIGSMKNHARRAHQVVYHLQRCKFCDHREVLREELDKHESTCDNRLQGAERKAPAAQQQPKRKRIRNRQGKGATPAKAASKTPMQCDRCQRTMLSKAGLLAHLRAKKLCKPAYKKKPPTPQPNDDVAVNAVVAHLLANEAAAAHGGGVHDDEAVNNYRRMDRAAAVTPGHGERSLDVTSTVQEGAQLADCPLYKLSTADDPINYCYLCDRTFQLTGSLRCHLAMAHGLGAIQPVQIYSTDRQQVQTLTNERATAFYMASAGRFAKQTEQDPDAGHVPPNYAMPPMSPEAAVRFDTYADYAIVGNRDDYRSLPPVSPSFFGSNVDKDSVHEEPTETQATRPVCSTPIDLFSL